MSIWVIGGTGESATIVRAISTVTSDFVVTVTTPEAQTLYSSKCLVVIGKIQPTAMIRFCQQYQIDAIVDVSHPFAITVSQEAIATAGQLKIPYLRYERATTNSATSAKHIELDSFNTLLQGNYLNKQRVLLTVGCQVLPLFKPWHSRSILFTRVLAKQNSLQIALDSGFPSDRIIAMRPPFSKALELALWQQWQISLVVTKASGKSGGEDIKRQIAEQLGISLITIARPPIIYPRQTSDLQEIIAFCRNYHDLGN